MNYYLKFIDDYYTDPGILLNKKEFDILCVHFSAYAYEDILMVSSNDRRAVLKFLYDVKMTKQIDRLLE